MHVTFPAAAPAVASRRKRGGLLIDIILGLLLLVGLLYGAYSYFQQGSTSRDLAAMNSRFIALSSEVRAQYANATTYGAANANITTAVQNGSTLKPAEFRNVTITGNGNTFTITITNLDSVVCTRLQGADLGPRSTVAGATNCTTGTLAVLYAA